MNANPYIIDSTLRDGAQAPGVVFHADEKLQIAALLDKLGIPELEIGTPAISAREINEMKLIASSGFRFKTLSWCRAVKEDIEKAVQAGTNGVNISFPVSDIHLLAMGKNRRWIFETLKGLTSIAKDSFEYFAIGLQDASRADLKFLTELIDLAFASGASRVRFADTVGTMNPLQVAHVFIKLKNRFPNNDFEFHGHNDLGLATANTIMALLSGASSASVTMNGLGERAGNAALEEVIMALNISTAQPLKLDTTHLSSLAEIVSRASGIDIPKNKPITGEKVLSHESGIHTNLILKNRKTYQVIEASSIGRTENEFVFGLHSGKSALINFLNKKKIPLGSDEISELNNKIKKLAYLMKRDLSENELLNLVVKEYHS